MRYTLSWLLLLGMATPGFLAAADTESNATNNSLSPLSAPAQDLESSDLSVPPASSSSVVAPQPQAVEIKDKKMPKSNLKPDLGLGTDAASSPSDMEEVKDSSVKEEGTSKKKKRRNKRAAHRAKSHKRSRCQKACSQSVNEAYKVQNSMYMNKETSDVSSCDQNASCVKADVAEEKATDNK